VFLYLTPHRLSSDPDTRPRNILPYIGLVIDHGWRTEKHCTPRSAINNAFRFFTPKFPRTSGPTWGNTLSSRLSAVCRTFVVTLAVTRSQRDQITYRCTAHIHRNYRDRTAHLLALSHVRLSRPTSCKVAAELFCPRVADNQRGQGNADLDLTTWQTVARPRGLPGNPGMTSRSLCHLSEGAADFSRGGLTNSDL